MKNYVIQDGFKEITEHFLGLDNQTEEIKKLKKLNSKLVSSNKELHKKNKLATKKLIRDQLTVKLTRKKSYGEVLENLTENFSFLNEKTLISFATSEYLFTNEAENMDYASVLLGYIKTLEISLRLLIDVRNKKDSTLGTLIHEIERYKELNAFAKHLGNFGILKLRNKAVHLEPISKHECGKLRKLLIEEGWLERLYFLISNSNEGQITTIKTNILNKTGIEKIGTDYYNCYSTASGKYLLSKSLFIEGHVESKAKKIDYQGFEYFII